MNWWEPEAEMRLFARRAEPDIARLGDRGFALMLRGHTLARERWALWEGILALALAQAENTAAAAWELTYSGYYAQARSLTRLLTDYLAVAWYLPDHPEEAHKWNDIGKESPHAGDLLQQVFVSDPDTGDNFWALRKHLSRFAHQDSLGLITIYSPGEDPLELGITLRARFEHRQFLATARDLLLLHASVPAAFSKWRGARNPEWEAEVTTYVNEVAAYLDKLDSRLALDSGSLIQIAGTPLQWEASSAWLVPTNPTRIASCRTCCLLVRPLLYFVG